MSQPSNEARILLALQAIQNNPTLSLRRAASIYKVPYSTLRRRQNGILAMRDAIPKSRKLSDLEENMIVQFILDLDSRGFPSRLRFVEEMANSLLADRDALPVGKRWAHNFMKRQPELRIRFFRKYDYQRAKCEDPTIIRGWFRLVENTIAKYGIRLDDLWNFDETGFMMGMIASGMIVTGSERLGRPKSVQPGNREWITVIQAVNAEGRVIPPFIIGAGQYHLANWYQEATLLGDWVIATSQNGWTDNQLGLEWLKHFDRSTAKRSNSRHRLLILDGHESHHSADFERYCQNNKIITLCMPAHASHLLQPLDVGCFAVLKMAYGREIEHLIRCSITHITKTEFFPAFHAAFQATFTEYNIRGGFRGAGLEPFDPENVISKLDVQLRTPTPADEVAEPSTPWISKTPKTALEAESQSEYLMRRIRRHRSSSPESILEAVISLAKGATTVMHKVVLQAAENRDLRQANEILSRRRRAKRTRLQKGGIMTVEEAREVIDQMGVDTQVVAESSRSGGQGRSVQPAVRQCGKMEVRQRQVQATADIDGVPVRKRMSPSNPYKEQPSVANVPCYVDYGSMLRLIPSTTDVDERYNRCSDDSALQSSLDEDISPSSSIIDAMEKLFMEYSQPEIQNATTNPRHDQLIGSSFMPGRNIRAHHPAERGFKTSKGDKLIEPFDFIWRMKNAPMIAKWEVHRVACHCSVDLEDVSLEYLSAWKDQDIFWKQMRQHKYFDGKAFPPKCDGEVWVQGHEQDLSAGRAVEYKARLCFDNANRKPKFELEIPVSEQSSRLRRKFGFNRIMELQLLFGDGCKSILKDKDQKRALARWLVHERHLFLHYEWAAFFIEEMKSRKEKAGLITPKITGKRVVLFGEQGAGLNFSSMVSGTTSHSNNLSTVMSVDPVCDRYSLLDWLLQIDSNLYQPYIKLFHRISLGIIAKPFIYFKPDILLTYHVLVGLSKTTLTVLLMEDSIRHRPIDIESPNGTPMNDGIGRISHSLLREVRDIMGLDFLPTAIQARIGGAKGLWMLDPIPFPSDERWIEIYPSQKKRDCNWSDPAHRTLEVVSVSSYRGAATLNLQFIPILEE
ncbi:hypothetical protein FSARC_2940 [Fusarium sarcochroum]|uniref:RNA-dependent RNA polymerase n=1 Tax=Fusarium sarcochroum TaxID=1208366 RepID=A0A8H4U4X8_9HYPO|nr:hypothetical protein FSARC_2940 [Fusarium sarcochroum]